MPKEKLVAKVFSFLNEWNLLIHNEVERRVSEEYGKEFGGAEEGIDKIIARKSKMREFYYSRISVTANVMIAITTLLVSSIALVVSIIALAISK